MTSRRLGICAIALVALLMFPSVARAGIGELIVEMSGPQFAGAIVRCRVPVQYGGRPECWIAPAMANRGRLATGVEKVWVAVEGGVYVSTGHDSSDAEYEFAQAWLFALEPMLEFRYAGDIRYALDKDSQVPSAFGGIGPLINRFKVRDGGWFTKYGVKLRPIAVAFGGWSVEYNIRLYPDGFTADEFLGPHIDMDRPFEAVHSVGFSVPWLLYKLPWAR